ncbi:MAG: tripartite tricarboxylate transporter permease, partial [Pseudomonadota bacterium]|nr:tripartite tricarboxylate transporter permease [Pseudomonadota bacterium]
MIGSTLLGVFIGALPGLNPVMAIALLLPLTYS